MKKELKALAIKRLNKLTATLATIPPYSELRPNDALKKWYSCEGEKMETKEEWEKKGYIINKYENPYLLWVKNENKDVYNFEKIKEVYRSSQTIYQGETK